MRRTATGLILAAAFSVLFCAGIAAAQDLHKTYTLGAGGHIVVKNVSGDVKIAGYIGNAITVDATRVGRDKDLVKVEEFSTGDRLELRVRYPESCNCDASVNFEIRVPASLDFDFERIGSVSGDVQIEGVRGRIHAASVSGNVSIENVSGLVSASSVSGNVSAEINRLEGKGEMKFASVSGNVDVKAPSNTDADVEMSSVSGSVDTNFHIEIQEKAHGVGRTARGRLGAGTNALKISTVSGKVSLTRI